MLNQKLYDILKEDGVAAIATCCDGAPHLVNTWHNFITVTEDGRLLIPAGGMNHTEENILKNNRIVMTVGSSKVNGNSGTPGAGFCIEGTAKFLTEGKDFDMMKEKLGWLTRVLEITADSVKETM